MSLQARPFGARERCIRPRVRVTSADQGPTSGTIPEGELSSISGECATMSGDEGARGPHAEPPMGDAAGWDAALARLEDVLLAAPFDRALPSLRELLERAQVPLSFVQQDDRALKLIHEAVLARPLSSRQEVMEARGQVELMTLEVEVLSERLRDPEASAESVAAARRRLAQIQDELARLRDLL
jgi:hypothetical protein